MKCTSCGNLNAWHTISRFSSKDGVMIDCCDQCGLEGGGEGIPDVYLGHIGQTFQALCDETGNPIPIQSKRHKKQVMDGLGLSEHPDRLKGTPWIEGSRDYRKRNFEQDRPRIRETMRQWRERA